eukprot:TRINITY_DN401_c0_g1_i1.p1 TRINITY_DN401_c0_g1~~TRINITY_DN401_c0_g1_i1.p1  ORF type:complete len:314 (+),score=98.53 TRINITY_DN401_c0_g1_i1:104-1045(+)
MSQKLITVIGATGQQGGSVINTFLSSPHLSKEYKLRAVTRDVTKESSISLSKRGVEVVQGDLSDPQSLTKAFEGSYAVFGVTNFWEYFSKEKEVAQGKAIADASKAAGVRHLVFSSLPSASQLSGGKLSHILHFDGKAEIEQYIESIKGDKLWATYFMPGFYMSNIKSAVNPGKDGVLSWSQPMNAETQIPLFDVVSDTGKFVAGIIQAGQSVNGKRVHAVSQWLRPNEVTDIASKVLSTPINFNEVSPDLFESFLPSNIAKELTENMLLIRDYSYYGKGAEKEQSQHDKYLTEGSKTTTWEDYVRTNPQWKL